MYSSNSQSFVLEHFVRMDTSQPESWLSAFQILTRSPRLSRKTLSSPGEGDFRGRLSFLETSNLNVLGTYLRSASLMSGTNAGSVAIIMPVEGRMDFKVVDDDSLCGPWAPFLLEPDEDYHAALSGEAHLLIIQLPGLTGSGYRPLFRRHQTRLIELLVTFLYETPFFRSYKHAQGRLEHLSTQLYGLIEARDTDTPLPEPDKQNRIRDDHRLGNAIQWMNDELESDINIESMARRAGLSLRSLHYLMKQYTGQSPYQYLQSRRLIKARESIIRNYPGQTSIAQQGLNWGFKNAGRFASYYEKHFGEYPSQTLNELDHLKQLTDRVRSVRDESGNTRQQWLTSSATTSGEQISMDSDLNKQA